MGTVIEDATDYYSARIPKKQRKGTIVDELLSDNQFRKYVLLCHCETLIVFNFTCYFNIIFYNS